MKIPDNPKFNRRVKDLKGVTRDLKKNLPRRLPKRRLLKKGRRAVIVLNPQNSLEAMKKEESKFFLR